MPIYSRQDLAEYALRSLGAPVLNIEIDDTQLEDAINTAILFFQEYHPDGTVRDFVKHKITGTVITVADATNIEVGMEITSGTTGSMVHEKTGNDLTITKMVGEHKFEVADTLSYPGGTTTITDVVLGDIDNEWIPMDEGIYGVTRVVPFGGYMGDGLFDITYQLRMNDLRNIHSGNMNYFVMSMSYIQMLDFILRKEKQFRFNRYMNRLNLDINWKSDIKIGNYLVFDVERTVDVDTYHGVLNNIWLKKLVTAEVKKYWGANLRKYNGVVLLGGVTLDGERIYLEAKEELAEIEQEIIQNQAPLVFSMG